MELTDIYGIGPVLAQKLKKKLKNRKIEDHYEDPDIWALLPESTKLFFKYKPALNIPRKIMEPVVEKIQKIGGIVAGSYRRGKDFCNDFDVLISQDQFDSGILKEFYKIGVLKPFVAGPEIIRTFIRIRPNFYIFFDIFIYRDLAPYLLYATGSKNFNKFMRGVAKKKGFLLNQNGLFKGKSKIDLKTEESIFDFLGLEYKKPFERNL